MLEIKDLTVQYGKQEPVMENTLAFDEKKKERSSVCRRKREREDDSDTRVLGPCPALAGLPMEIFFPGEPIAVKIQRRMSRRSAALRSSMIFSGLVGDFLNPIPEDRQAVCGIHMYSQQDVKE